MIILLILALIAFVTIMRVANKVFGSNLAGSAIGVACLVMPFVAILAVGAAIIITVLMPLLFTVAPIGLFLAAVAFVMISIAKGGKPPSYKTTNRVI